MQESKHHTHTRKDNNLKSYLNVIRRTVIGNHFLLQYFLKIVVIYMISNGVTTWVAVSIPVVLDFSRTLSRGFRKIISIGVNANYKKYFLLYVLITCIICLLISQSHNLYIIYLLTIILGFLCGTNDLCITRIDTSNKKYESFCLMEEERASVIGGTLGLIISQIFYDINPIMYILGFIIFGLIIFCININIPSIDSKDDCMEPINEENQLSKTEKKNIFSITILYALLTGTWCIGSAAMSELIPLIANKVVGYLNAIYTLTEIIALFIINANIINKFKKSGRLLYWETICAVCDILYLLTISVFPNILSIAFIMFLYGISSTIGDPIWGAIISSYSENNRVKYALVNNIYFAVRTITSFISIFVCRYFVIKGIYSFKYLALILLVTIIIIYIISNRVNKKIFGRSI